MLITYVCSEKESSAIVPPDKDVHVMIRISNHGESVRMNAGQLEDPVVRR